MIVKTKIQALQNRKKEAKYQATLGLGLVINVVVKEKGSARVRGSVAMEAATIAMERVRLMVMSKGAVDSITAVGKQVGRNGGEWIRSRAWWGNGGRILGEASRHRGVATRGGVPHIKVLLRRPGCGSEATSSMAPPTTEK